MKVVGSILALSLLALPGGGRGQVYEDSPYAADPYAEGLEARVWLDRGHEPVYQRGDHARVYYRVSYDAFVAIFHIDTNGTTRMIYPRSPDESHYTRGGRDYRLIFPESPFWLVDEHPGMGYFFVVASAEPFDFSGFDYAYYEGGWDLTRVGRHVYRDPYVAMDDYVAALIPDWEYADYGVGVAAYHVGEPQAYPRFLCYDCHAFRPYTTWNPYRSYCTSFRVVVWSDPYVAYPGVRYGGSRVVYARTPRQPRFEFKERVRGEPGEPIFSTRGPREEGASVLPPRRERGQEYGEPRYEAGSRAGSAGSDVRRPRPAGPEGLPQRAPGSAAPSRERPGTPDSRSSPEASRPPTGLRRPTSGLPGASRPDEPLRRPSVTPRRPSGAVPDGRQPTASPEPSRRPAQPREAPSYRPPSSGGSRAQPQVRPPAASNPRSRPSVAPSRPPGGTPSVRVPRSSAPPGGARVTPPSSTPRQSPSVRPSRPPASGSARPAPRRPVKKKGGDGG